jgi:two-component system LytT family response regulator
MIAATEKLNVLIVDDETHACMNLNNMLTQYTGDLVKVVGIANNTADAAEMIHRLQSDAVFLDIDMPHENAFQFLRRIDPVNFEIVFVTAYDEYAIKAFKLNAFDYILKPIDIDELVNCVTRLSARISQTRMLNKTTTYQDLHEQIAGKSLTKMVLRSASGTMVVEFEDILFVEAQQNYSKFHFTRGGCVVETITSTNLMEYEDLLPAHMFFRTHRSYLINCMYVDHIVNSDQNYVVIKDTFKIPISRRRYLPLKEFLKSYGHRLKND